MLYDVYFCHVWNIYWCYNAPSHHTACFAQAHDTHTHHTHARAYNAQFIHVCTHTSRSQSHVHTHTLHTLSHVRTHTLRSPSRVRTHTLHTLWHVRTHTSRSPSHVRTHTSRSLWHTPIVHDVSTPSRNHLHMTLGFR